MKSYTLFSLVILVFLFSACSEQKVEMQTNLAAVANLPTKVDEQQRPDGWDDYWYKGLAELNSYKLVQNRYGTNREGKAVLIFVTEPFLAKSQVKDDGIPTTEQSLSVLKTNRIQRFNTGIYDYSLMSSVFTPVSSNLYPQTLKTSLSAQDWCGHSWWQLNLSNKKYKAKRLSYFQSEGDAEQELPIALLEDEIPNRVRLNPESLPTGKQMVIQGAIYSALFHKLPKAYEALITKELSDSEMIITLKYSHNKRSLVYHFDKAFPFKLMSWEERQNNRILSSATLLHSSQKPYWSQNSPRFAALRDSLMLN